jgi:integrase/recombinase XerD
MSNLVPYQSSLSGVTTDEQLIKLWLLDKRSELTRKKYEADINRFRDWAGVPFKEVSLPMLRAYEQTLTCGHARKMRVLACIKSVLTYGERIGYLQWNVGKAIQLAKVADQRGRRYLTEEQVMKMLTLEEDTRNHALLRLLYSGGLRVSELCGLRWKDVIDRPEINTGQVIVWGKGSKERAIVLSAGTYEELASLRGDAGPDDPVFRAHQSDGEGLFLDPAQVFRIVEDAAIRAGLHVFQKETVHKGQPVTVTHSKVSPHWLRHSHASHYLARKGNVAVLQKTLGHESLATTTLYAHALPDESSSLGLSI